MNIQSTISSMFSFSLSQLYPIPKIFSKPQAPEDILRKLTQEKVTINFHENCLTPTNFTKYGVTTLHSLTSFENLSFTINLDTT